MGGGEHHKSSKHPKWGISTKFQLSKFIIAHIIKRLILYVHNVDGGAHHDVLRIPVDDHGVE